MIPAQQLADSHTIIEKIRIVLKKLTPSTIKNRRRKSPVLVMTRSAPNSNMPNFHDTDGNPYPFLFVNTHNGLKVQFRLPDTGELFMHFAALPAFLYWYNFGFGAGFAEHTNSVTQYSIFNLHDDMLKDEPLYIVGSDKAVIEIVGMNPSTFYQKRDLINTDCVSARNTALRTPCFVKEFRAGDYQIRCVKSLPLELHDAFMYEATVEGIVKMLGGVQPHLPRSNHSVAFAQAKRRYARKMLDKSNT